MTPEAQLGSGSSSSGVEAAARLEAKAEVNNVVCIIMIFLQVRYHVANENPEAARLKAEQQAAALGKIRWAAGWGGGGEGGRGGERGGEGGERLWERSGGLPVGVGVGARLWERSGGLPWGRGKGICTG